MIRPPGTTGAAFSEASDGDLRRHLEARSQVSLSLGIPSAWAWVNQIHAHDVVRVSQSGDAGAADAMWTSERHLPIAVFTADCLGVVLRSTDAVGVAHAGWRGATQAVVTSLRTAMTDSGFEPNMAYVGPGIGSCCFEVGPDVSERFPEHVATTTWGTASVDLVESVSTELIGMEVWTAGACTFHEDSWFSDRRDGTRDRMAALAWLP